MYLRLGICACINEPSWAHMNTCACLEAREMRDVNFFWTQHLLKCCVCISFTYYFFFFGYYVMHLLFIIIFCLGMLPRMHLFMGHMFWKPWVGCRIYLIGARDSAGSRNKNKFDSVWESGLETCFKSQFGANRPGWPPTSWNVDLWFGYESAWVTTQVSKRRRMGDESA